MKTLSSIMLKLALLCLSYGLCASENPRTEHLAGPLVQQYSTHCLQKMATLTNPSSKKTLELPNIYSSHTLPCSTQGSNDGTVIFVPSSESLSATFKGALCYQIAHWYLKQLDHINDSENALIFQAEDLACRTLESLGDSDVIHEKMKDRCFFHNNKQQHDAHVLGILNGVTNTDNTTLHTTIKKLCSTNKLFGIGLKEERKLYSLCTEWKPVKSYKSALKQAHNITKKNTLSHMINLENISMFLGTISLYNCCLKK